MLFNVLSNRDSAGAPVGQVQVPEVRGLTLEQAQKALLDANLLPDIRPVEKSDVADDTVTELTVTPVPENTAVALAWKPVPATTRFWLTAPCPREAGVTDVTVGGVTTVKPPVRLLAPLSGLVTVTSRGPTVAVEATVTLTSNCVEFTNVAVLTDPSQYIRNVGLDENAGAMQLSRVVRNAFQEEINKRTVKELLSLKRQALLEDVKREVLQAVKGEKPWGVDVIDVRITRADYVDAITESVYRRMEAERKRVANELRSMGAAEGEKIRADADRQREVTIANAYREAQMIKGEGDAEAARIYADSFGRDAQFAKFYRSLEAYKSTFSKKSDLMVLDPSSDFFNAMRSSGGGSAPAPKK